MKEKATIYDFVRVCRFHDECQECPLWDNNCCDCSTTLLDSDVDKLNDIILKWCKEHPVKTRQDKFLEMFPNADLF